MRTYKKELEIIANDLLLQRAEANRPNYSNRDFVNTVIIFETALVDKLYDMQEQDNLSFEDKLKMAESCGTELRRLIYVYTGLDMHDVKNIL